MSNTTRKRKTADTDNTASSKRLCTESGRPATTSDAGCVEAGACPVASPEMNVGPAVDEHAPVHADVQGKGTEQASGVVGASGGPTDVHPCSTKPKHKIRKLVPQRPFPAVPTSVSATGPRSVHTEGKNYICISRKTNLGAYLRRCKDVFLKDGYRTLHLSAMGAAIPHLMQLALSLPAILPFAQDEIHKEILTGTVEVKDEMIPEDEDEDITYRTRGKSTLQVTIKVGDGVDEKRASVTSRRRG